MSQDLWNKAVARRIISTQQALLLEKLQNELKKDAGFNLSLTHVLWAGGTALIITSLILFGVEIKKNSNLSLAWFLTIYAIGFALFARVLAFWQKNARILWGCLGAAAVALISGASIAFHDDYLKANDLSWLGPFNSKSPPLDAYDKPIVPSVWDAFIASGLSFGFFSAIVAIWYLRRSGFLPIWIIISIAIFTVYYEALRLLFSGLDQGDLLIEISALTYGVALLALSLFQDRTAIMNHGFWVNKVSWIAISVGMTGLYKWGEWWEVLFVFVCLAAALYSVYIRRPGGVNFAALGIFGFLMDNILEIFPNIWGGILVCTVVGSVLILIGLVIFRNQDKFDRFIPQWMHAARPAAREDPVTFGF